MIGELGLRYRPANQADLAAHAMMLKLLTEAFSDMPPGLLRRACSVWTKTKAFMPKESELRAIANGMDELDRKAYSFRGDGGSRADVLNEELRLSGRNEFERSPIWAMVDGRCELVGRPIEQRFAQGPLTQTEIDAMLQNRGIAATWVNAGMRRGWIVEDGYGGYRDSQG